MPTYTANFPYVSPEIAMGGLAAIINRRPANSGAIEIRRVRISPASGTNPNNIPANTALNILLAGRAELVRISAVSGGSSLAFSKFDTASGSLGGLVSALAFPQSVTEVENLLLRSDNPGPTFANQVAGASNSRTLLGSGGSRRPAMGTSDQLFSSFLQSTEGIRIREGEGVALMQRTFCMPHAKKLRVVLREISGPPGHTYWFTSPNVGSPPTLTTPIWALFNAVGSGKVLEIVRIEFAPDGDAASTPFLQHEAGAGPVTVVGQTLRMCYLDEAFGGTPVTPARHDTSNNVPSGIACFAGPFVAFPFGYNLGVPYDEFFDSGSLWSGNGSQTPGNAWPMAKSQRNTGLLRTDVFGPCAREANLGLMALEDDHVLYDARGGPGILINPGMGFGLVGASKDYPDQSVYNLYDIEITFNFLPVYQSANVVTVLT